MTPDEREFLRQAFQAMGDAPLEPGDPRYVDLSAVRGLDDPVAVMARTIELSAGDSVQTFWGFPGTGKTTELKRLGQRLTEQGYEVGFVDVPSLEKLAFGHKSDTAAGTVLIVDFAEYVPRIDGIHVVARVSPYTDPRALMLPSVTTHGPDGNLHQEGLEALKAVVAKRTDRTRLFGDADLERLIRCSGGNLRDLLRLIRETIRRATALPVSRDAVESAIEQVRAELHLGAEYEMALLAEIARTHSGTTAPNTLSRWADAHLLQLYRNGRYWYDVHPLIRDTVLQHAPPTAARGLDAAPASPKPARPAAPQATPAVLTPDMCVTLVVESYRALRRVRWTLPRGVSALVGPNGSGKTTLLDVPDLLRHTLTHDVRKAIDHRGGPGSLRSVQTDRKAPVIVGVELDQLTWQLDLSAKDSAFYPLYGEHATLSGVAALDPSTLDLDFSADDTRPLLRRVAEQPEGAAFRPLVALLEGYRLYGTYDIPSIREHGSQVSSDEHLLPDGRNIFSVLRNWRDRKETRPRWDFVLASLKESFPDTFDDLDFDMAGQTVAGRIVAPQPDVRIPTYFAANGWLVALLHLAAVASTGPAGVVAIDEMENGLHPYAIRALIDAMRRWAELTGISIVLATHSPVVLDQFKDMPDHVFVMEPGREPAPTRLDELHAPEWLAHFSLGDLYAHDEFGAQHKDGDRVA